MNKKQTYFEAVAEFHRKFGFPIAGEDNVPHLLNNGSSNIALFRRNFLEEEMTEFKRAQDADDLVEIADALVDLVYVALGTAHYYGLPFDELFDEVQRSNMEKVRVQQADESKRGTVWDVRKPEGWRPPDLGRIIRQRYGGKT